MDEFSKIIRVIKKIDSDAPQKTIIVLDATTGQNAIEQATKFTEATEVSCLALTKLDGTAKGGILIAAAKKFKLPIIAIGLGEKEDDLQLFNAEKFAEAFTQIN